MTADEKRTEVGRVPFWFHSFDFGDGVTVPGRRTAAELEIAWDSLHLPELSGQSVLDVNTWDGWFAIRCERAGAARVVGLDWYVWAMDLAEHTRYWQAIAVAGTAPRPYHEMPYFKPDTLPGKIGFDTARRLRGSRVEELVGDFSTMDLAPIRGQFDVVLFLGSLYHMTDPIGNLRRVYDATRPGGLAVVETHAIAVAGLEDVPLCESYGPVHLLNQDPSNWWGPNALALKQMLLAAGFTSAEIVTGPPPGACDLPAPSGRGVALRRVLPYRVRRLLPEPAPEPPRIAYYRAFAHARRG
jgi:tRNA (mo5U34)-methyltransferase